MKDKDNNIRGWKLSKKFYQKMVSRLSPYQNYISFYNIKIRAGLRLFAIFQLYTLIITI